MTFANILAVCLTIPKNSIFLSRLPVKRILDGFSFLGSSRAYVTVHAGLYDKCSYNDGVTDLNVE